jgi:putative peptide zinc metalloprotease protein
MKRHLDPTKLLCLLLGAIAAAGVVGAPAASLAQTAPDTTSAPAVTSAPAAPSVSTVDPSATGGSPVAGGGPRNLVKVQNLQNNQLRVDGNVQLGRIPGPNVGPVNLAEAYSSCTGCQTLAVALQIDLTSPDSQIAVPQNGAVAVNFECTNCVTKAMAIQYVLPVDDPTQVPPEANQLVAQMGQELKQMNGDQTLTLTDAVARVNAVVAQFDGLKASLNEQQDESTDPTTPNAPPPA